MKYFNKKTAVLLFSVILFSCQPEDIRDFGGDRDIVTSLNGNWKLTKASQVDEDAATKGFPYKEKDITNTFAYTDFKVTFNTTNGSPTNFSSIPGASPKIIKLVSGTWMVDNLDYPKFIYLASGPVTDTVSLGSYPVGAANTFKIKKEKRDAATGKLLISYNYEFTKQ